MSPTVNRREREDDCGSDTSTIKAVPFPRRSCSTDSVKSYGKIRYVNPASTIVDEDSDDFDTSSDEISSEDESMRQPQTTKTKMKQIDLSPEAVQKRKEVYNKWLQSVKERERKTRLEREIREAKIEEERKFAEQQRKEKAEKQVQEWMEKKRIQAEEKMARIIVMKKKIVAVKEKPKEYKRAINFQDWINQKNKNYELEKKRREEEQKISKSYQKCRENVSAQSYDKWIRTASSKAKPVPMCKGLESLRGSSAKIQFNPEPWIDDWD